MDDGLTERQSAFLAFRDLREAIGDLSAQDINRMSMSDFTEISRRADLPAVDPFSEAYLARPSAQQEPSPAPPQPPQRPDVASMSWQDYAAWRESSGLAERSAEGMSRASIRMSDRWAKSDVPVNGRTSHYSGQ